MAAKNSLMLELVKTKEQMENLKRHYANRIRAMEEEVKQVQQERDKVLESMANITGKTEDEKHEIIQKYEAKLRSINQVSLEDARGVFLRV